MEPFYFKRYDMVIGKAENPQQLKAELERLRVEDPLAVLYHLKEGHISLWLAASGHSDLANAIKPSMSIEEAIVVLSRPPLAKKPPAMKAPQAQKTQVRSSPNRKR